MIVKKYFCIILIFILCGCESPKNKDTSQNTIVGFSQIGIESAWRRENTASILESAKDYNIQVMYENGMLDQQKQISDIRKFISYQVDVIILSPIIETGWDEVLLEAQSADIPIIIADREITTNDNNLYVTHVGSNFKSQGIRAGNFLKEKYSEKDTQNINIIEISGNKNSTPTIYRSLGFTESIHDESKFTIIDQEPGNYIRSQGKEAMNKILLRTPLEKIDVIYSHNDDMTLGILECLSEKDQSIIEDITIITVDGQQQMMDNLKSGQVNAIIECNPYSGPLIMNVVNKIMNNETVSKEINLAETYYTEFSDMTRFPYNGY